MSKLYFTNSHSQQGFLSIVSVLLIMVVGFIGLSVAYMTMGSANSTNNFFQSEQALYIAQAGFAEAARLLQTPHLSGANARIGCSALTSNSLLTNTTFSTGTFTAT